LCVWRVDDGEQRKEKRREEKRGERQRPVALHDLDDGEQRS
jgi:hypothetical protein